MKLVGFPCGFYIDFLRTGSVTMLFLKHLYLFIKNNLLQLQRKWLSLPLLILFPVAILLLITTIAITVISPSDQEPVHIGFVDLNQSEETQLKNRRSSYRD